MPFTVAAAQGRLKDAEYEEYVSLLSRLLLKQGVNLADVPRVEEQGNGERWLYVWPTAQEARAFADRLKEQSPAAVWVVREVDAPSSRGPLRPLEIQAGHRRDGWTFALAPWTRKAIQARFPGACRNHRISIFSEMPMESSTASGLEALARPVLHLLTGLSVEQLQVFGSFVVSDPVTETELLSPAPIQP